MAASLHRLAMAGERVKWAAEPVLLSTIVFLVIISVWMNQWSNRHLAETTIGLVLLHVIKLLLPYLAAAFVYPEHVAETGEIDLLAHYDRTRFFTYGALIAGLLLFWIDSTLRKWIAHGPLDLWTVVSNGPWDYVVLYLVLIFVRIRWLSIALLSGGLLYYAWIVIPISLHQ
jgi:hypothetical protein